MVRFWDHRGMLRIIMSKLTRKTGSPHLAGWTMLWTAILAGVTAGCAHRPSAIKGGDWLSPRAPSFLRGPAAVLLTNTDGFSAHIVAGTRTPDNFEYLAGELLGRGSKLLFAPQYEKETDKSYRTAGLSFVWDVNVNGGYIMSEALQAYAPMAADFYATNSVVHPGGLARQKIDGHPCEPEQVTLYSSDGTTAVFEVWRATDEKGFPLRMSAVGVATPPRLDISKFRLGAPPAELFRPPAGFTQYESAEQMMGELATRLANLKRKEPLKETVEQSIGGMNQPPGGH